MVFQWTTRLVAIIMFIVVLSVLLCRVLLRPEVTE